jgi:hypothetical protein
VQINKTTKKKNKDGLVKIKHWINELNNRLDIIMFHLQRSQTCGEYQNRSTLKKKIIQK